MIVPMRKLSLLVLKSEQKEALFNLRKLGIVHIEERPASSARITELKNKQDEIALAVNLLSEFVPKKASKNEPSLMSEKDSLECLDSVINLNSEYKTNVEKLTQIRAELDSYRAWGDFNSEDLALIKERGVFLFPATVPEKIYGALKNSKTPKGEDLDIRAIVLGEEKKTVRILIWSDSEELPKNLPVEVELLKMPSVPIKELKSQSESLKKKIASYSKEMQKISAYLNSLKELDKIISKKLEFELVSEGMDKIPLGEADVEVSQNAGSSGGEELARVLVYLTGYLPVEKEKEFSAIAMANAWAYILDEPSEEDSVPTKLKYNKFFNLITPLLDFLGTLPGYREADISPFFLLFFGVFFAMIFGDGGYGALIFLGSVGMMIKTKLAKKPIGTGLILLAYLGFMTVVWGTLVCNWFGIPAQNMPTVLQNLSLPAISNLTPVDVRNQNQILLCFSLGLLQLLIGHLISLLRNIKKPVFLADLGSMAMLCGMYFVVLNLVVDGEKYKINNPVLLSIGIGFALYFLFVNYSTGIVQSLLDSLKNLINMLLGVVNVFADIMSYIRLWAVALAGSAISETVNTMAGPILGGFIIFAGILLLIFGHGLNIIMTVLSVIVHGVRLNTLEFSNHVGLTWSGFKYEPFNE